MQRAILLFAIFCTATRVFAAENAELYRLVTVVDNGHPTLETTLKSIASHAGLKATFDADAIRDGNIRLIAPVHATLRSIPAGDAFHSVLSGSGLKFEISGQSVNFTTRLAIESRITEVAYPVGDLILVDLGVVQPGIEGLAEYFKKNVRPTSWKADGKSPHSFIVDEKRQQFIVRSTKFAHAEIVDLLQQIRRARRSAQSQLMQSKVTVQGDNMPLADVLNLLSQQAKVSVVLESNCPNPLVSLHIKDVTAEQALEQVLKPLGLSRSEFYGTVRVSDLRQTRLTRTYPVADLVGWTQNGRGQASGDYAPLIAKITKDVMPESWDSKGGKGSIIPYSNNGSLVVSQCQPAHKQIADLLAGMRAKPATP